MLSQLEIDELIRALQADQKSRIYLDTREEVSDLKRKIRHLTWKWCNLSEREKIELDLAESRLRDVQRTCMHYMERHVMFTFVRLVCSRCDLEDKSYRLIDEPKKQS